MITLARHDYGHDERTAQAQQLYAEAVSLYQDRKRRRKVWRQAGLLALCVLAAACVMVL